MIIVDSCLHRFYVILREFLQLPFLSSQILLIFFSSSCINTQYILFFLLHSPLISFKTYLSLSLSLTLTLFILHTSHLLCVFNCCWIITIILKKYIIYTSNYESIMGKNHIIIFLPKK